MRSKSQRLVREVTRLLSCWQVASPSHHFLCVVFGAADLRAGTAGEGFSDRATLRGLELATGLVTGLAACFGKRSTTNFVVGLVADFVAVSETVLLTGALTIAATGFGTGFGATSATGWVAAKVA